MIAALLWAITQRVAVISYHRLGKTYRSLGLGPMLSPETSVRNYHHLLRNNSEERSSHLLRGGSLKPRLTLTNSTEVHQYNKTIVMYFNS
jgi:hypothetical protein